MTDDRELLELAAKAAGWKGWRSKHGYWNVASPEGESGTHCHHWNAYCPDTGEKLREPTFADAIAETNWNPLTDDGDALRLAVKLGLDVCIDTVHEREPHTHAIGFCSDVGAETLDAIEAHGDPYAATRRAIVRAAAEIGRSME